MLFSLQLKLPRIVFDVAATVCANAGIDAILECPYRNETPPIHHAFLNWSEAVESLFANCRKGEGTTGQHIHVAFDGINPAICALLSNGELTVVAEP